MSSMGMIDLVEYVHSSVINYVDTDRVGVMGHSMGGNNSWMTIRYFGRLYNEAIEQAKAPDSEEGETITEAEQAYADSKLLVSAVAALAERLLSEDLLVRRLNVAAAHVLPPEEVLAQQETPFFRQQNPIGAPPLHDGLDLLKGIEALRALAEDFQQEPLSAQIHFPLPVRPFFPGRAQREGAQQ